MRPKAPGQRGPIDHARRDEIVRAANEHFRQFGYDKTTVGDLARAIGFSTAHVYKFFGSKQSIGDAICSLCLDRISADGYSVAVCDKPASERLGLVIKLLADRARELCRRETKLRDLVIAAHREHWRSFEAHEATLRGIVTRIIEDGRHAGEFERATPIDETCRAILMVLEPFRNPALWDYRLAELDEQAAALTALVLRSLQINL